MLDHRVKHTCAIFERCKQRSSIHVYFTFLQQIYQLGLLITRTTQCHPGLKQKRSMSPSFLSASFQSDVVPSPGHLSPRHITLYNPLSYHLNHLDYVRLMFSPYSSHLSSSGPVAHKAEVNLLHLSAATRLASFQLFHPSIRLSFSIVDRHVVFSRPTFLLPSGVQVSAVSHLQFLSIRRICPTHFHLLNLTSVLIVFNFVFVLSLLPLNFQT